MSRYHDSAEGVPEGLRIPKWSWRGLVSGEDRRYSGNTVTGDAVHRRLSKNLLELIQNMSLLERPRTRLGG